MRAGKKRGRSITAQSQPACFVVTQGCPHMHRPRQESEKSIMTNPKLEVLTPENCQLIFIDHQPQMAFGVQSMDRQAMKNNVVGLAKAAAIFNIPTTITTV